VPYVAASKRLAAGVLWPPTGCGVLSDRDAARCGQMRCGASRQSQRVCCPQSRWPRRDALLGPPMRLPGRARPSRFSAKTNQMAAESREHFLGSGGRGAHLGRFHGVADAGRAAVRLMTVYPDLSRAAGRVRRPAPHMSIDQFASAAVTGFQIYAVETAANFVRDH
jgi:hypothetical protein